MMISTIRDHLPSVGGHLGSVSSAIAGAATTVPVVNAAIGAIGFTASGITSGSVAASMMSTAAVANGGGIAAGSTVALLQSVGALGLTSLGTLPILGLCATGACTATGIYFGGKSILHGLNMVTSKL